MLVEDRKVHESSPVLVNDTRTIAGDDSYFFLIHLYSVIPYQIIDESCQFVKIDMIHDLNDTGTIGKQAGSKN